MSGREAGAAGDDEVPTYEEVAELVSKAVENGSERLAASRFDEVVANAPENPLGYLGRGYARGRLGEDEGARSDFDQAVELAPGQAAPYAVRGRYLKRRGELPAALSDFDRAVQLAPNDPAVLLERAAASAARGAIAAALADHERAIELAPSSPRGYRRRGSLLETLGHYVDALADFNRAIELGHRTAHAYRDRADAHAALDQFADAIADYRRALEQDPRLVGAHLGLARMLSLIRQPEESVRSYDAAIRLDPSLVEPYRLRALEHEALGRLDDAVADLDRAIDLDPTLEDALLARGRVYGKQGHAADAFQDYDLALALIPDSAEAWLGRADSLLALDDPDEAELNFRQAIELSPYSADAWSGLVYSLFVQGDRLLGVEHAQARRDRYRMALEASEHAAEACPGEVIFQGYRASALRLLDGYDLGVAAAKDALAEAGEDDAMRPAWVLRELGDCLRLWGETLRLPERLAAAVDALGRAEADAADDEERGLASELRGHALLALDEDERALTCFRAAARANPQGLWSQLGQGKIHLRSRRFDAALECFDRVFALDDSSELADWARTGRWLALEGIGAHSAEEAAAHALPRPDAGGHLERAEHLEFFGALDRSLADRRRAAELAPERADALNSLAWFHADHGGPAELAEALGFIRSALELLPPGDPARANYLDTAGWIAYRMEHHERAAAWLTEAVALDPLPLLFRWHLRQAEAALVGGENRA
jgi:tetratricopeptide (TPR) repeat protein